MIKTSTNNIAKSKKKKAIGDKYSSLAHYFFENILNLRNKNFHKIILKIILVICSFAAAIFILEIFLRITEKKTYDLSGCVSLDKKFHHVMIPNKACRFKTSEWDIMYKINDYGLRDYPIAYKKEGGTFRILFIGDSFVQGHGVDIDNSLTKLLEKKLNENIQGKKFEVINAGVFGYSPLVEYLYLKNEGLKFEPDLALVGFNVTDFQEDTKRFEELQMSYPNISENNLNKKIAGGEAEFNYEKINSAAKTTSTQKVFLPQLSYHIKQWLRENSKTYKILADFIKKINQPLQKDAINQGNINDDIVAIMRGDKISGDDWAKLWILPIEYLKLMSQLLKNQNIPIIVIAIPDAVQVADNEWPNRTALGYPQNFEDPRGPFQNELAKRLESSNIPIIDLLPIFKVSGIFPLYFSHDGHWRESGHKLAADEIFKILKSEIPKLERNKVE